MPLTPTIESEPESGLLADLIAADRHAWGYLPNFTKTFGIRPEVYAAWRQLNGAIKAAMPARRYELATLGAALERRSSYCSLAHGKVLAEQHVPVPQLVALARGTLEEDRSPEDAAIVAFARLVARDPVGIGHDDLAPLRAAGLADDEIFDLILAVAARCFFSTVLDATDTEADAELGGLSDPLPEVLTVGRPIAAADPAAG